MQSETDYNGIYATWNVDVDGRPGNDDPWTFGAADQYPVLKYAGMDTTAQFAMQPPGIPASVTVTPKADTLDVRWRAASYATGYKVQWKAGGQNYAASRQATTTETRHKISNLTLGTTYTVRVIATKTGASDGRPSSEVTGIPTSISYDLDVDDDGGVYLLSDMLLIIRHLLGFEEGTLTPGLVTPQARRRTYRELDAYIGTLTQRLDVDDDGGVYLLSDMLLIIRHLLGFEEGTLTPGLVTPQARRRTYRELDAYIDSLYPPSP